MLKAIVIDTETSGVDTKNDRIIELVIVEVEEDGSAKTNRWLINPGVDIPEEASAVHGYTPAYLEEHGDSPSGALFEALHILNEAWTVPWILYNANFDLSILDAEFARHDIEQTFGRQVRDKVRVIDPLVIDRANDKYRKGKRTLEAVAKHYGVEFDAEKAHAAEYDCLVTLEVARKVVKKYGMPTNDQQAKWHREWAAGLESFLRKSDPEAVVERSWPIR